MISNSLLLILACNLADLLLHLLLFFEYRILLSGWLKIKVAHNAVRALVSLQLEVLMVL